MMAMISILSFGKGDYHIGIVTGTVSQSEDALRGAEKIISKYGDVKDGGMITHITFPDNFMQEMETTISQITALASDPKMKAIIMGEAIPGTVEAYRRVREKRPDILLFTNTTHEDPEMVSEVADLSLYPDAVARGYLIVKAAQEMGAKKFAHISFPRHLSYEMLSRRRNIMKETAADLGMGYIDISAPDPVSDVGVAGAQQYILEQVPNWLNQYGKETAFFATNDAHTEPLLKRVAEEGGYFVEADLPSPTMGYPGALGVKFDETEKGNWPKILAKVEKAVIEKGGKGRMGTWAYSYNFSGVIALAEHAMNVIDGKSEVSDFDSIMKALGNSTPGAGWNGSLLEDSDGIERENFLLVYQDTYVFGKGYMGMTKKEIPKKYFDVK
jgi:hypothetical protein